MRDFFIPGAKDPQAAWDWYVQSVGLEKDEAEALYEIGYLHDGDRYEVRVRCRLRSRRRRQRIRRINRRLANRTTASLLVFASTRPRRQWTAYFAFIRSSGFKWRRSPNHSFNGDRCRTDLGRAVFAAARLARNRRKAKRTVAAGAAAKLKRHDNHRRPGHKQRKEPQSLRQVERREISRGQFVSGVEGERDDGGENPKCKVERAHAPVKLGHRHPGELVSPAKRKEEGRGSQENDEVAIDAEHDEGGLGRRRDRDEENDRGETGKSASDFLHDGDMKANKVADPVEFTAAAQKFDRERRPPRDLPTVARGPSGEALGTKAGITTDSETRLKTPNSAPQAASNRLITSA